MLKPLILALVGCLGFSSCAALTKSQTWEKVMQVRPVSNGDEEGPSAAYAADLHTVLKAAAVEHKVVKYEYHYTTRLREESVGTRTAVIYRDETDPNNPWWLKEACIARPVWVSGDHSQGQLAFYIHHDVSVLNEKDFSGSGEDHKATVAMARSANGYQYAGASQPGRLKSKTSSNYYEMAAVLPQSAAQRSSYAALFRSVYGRAYRSSSAADRRKMANLQREAARHRRPLASQTF